MSRCAQQHLHATFWICLLLRVLGDASEADSCGPLCVAGSKEHQRLSDAAARLAKAVGAFDRLREALHAEPQQVLEDLRSKLHPDQAEALAGEDDDSTSLQARFAALQGRVLEVSATLNVQCGPTTHGDEAPRGLGIPVCSSTMEVTTEMEQLASDLEAQLVRIEGYAMDHLHVQNGHNQQSSILERQVRTTHTVAASAGETMDLQASPSRLPRDTADGDEVKAAADAATQRILRLTDVTRQLANPQLLQEARRLAASLAHAVEGSDGASKIEALSKEIQRLTEEAERSLELEQRRGANHGGSSSGAAPQQRAFTERGSFATDVHSTGATTAAGAASGVCSEPAVRRAAATFDETLQSFREGGLVRSMLPPELENLHRVVHSMEVLRHLLLSDLRRADGSIQMSSHGAESQLSKDCQRYFAGVGQLQSDLAYYQGAAGQR